MANGKFLGIKKTYILRTIAIACFLGFLSFVFISIFLFKSPTLWFYAFCVFVGLFELLKAFLFKFDSSVYLGTLLLCIGISGFIFTYTNTEPYSAFYIAISFILASIFTFIFCGQRFHLIIAFSIFFVSIYAILYVINLINLPILIAFLVPFLLLLIVEILWLCFHKK